MKRCNGCSWRCELGYTISANKMLIAPRVGDVTYWEYDMYASGVRRVLFRQYVGTGTYKARLKLLMLRRARDIARYCEMQR